MSARTQKACRVMAWGAAVLGLILVSGEYWADILYPLMFDATGELRTDGLFRTLSPWVLQLWLTLNSGWIVGLPPLFAGVAGLAFLYGGKSVRFPALRSRPLTTVALVTALLAHVIIAATSVPLFLLPDGSSIRPMGWAMFVTIVSFLALLLVEPISVVAVIRERPRFLAVIGLAVGLTPYFFSLFLLECAMWLKGLKLSD